MAATGEHPALSVIMVSHGGVDVLQDTLSYLRRQTVADRIELVLVLATFDDAEPPPSGFHDVVIVPMERIDITGEALAAGIREASAPIVAYAEEHAFPEPGWAEALIAAHGGPWTGVGATLDNANPGTATSWAHLYTDFGPAVHPVPSGEVTALPWHSTAYKRAALLAYGDGLPMMLEVEGMLQADLVRNGHRLYLESAARLRHTNPSTLQGHVMSEFLGGRMFGAARAARAGWSFPHRLMRALAWPITPGIRLRRTLPHVRRRAGTADRLVPRILPALLVGLGCHALGEAFGYVFGDGGAMQRRTSVELNRGRYITAADRRDLAARHAAAERPAAGPRPGG